MTTCTAQLGAIPGHNALTCTLPKGHPYGHIYESSTGSDVADRHDVTSGGEH